MAEKLNEAQIADSLRTVPEWIRKSDAILRTFRFNDFTSSIDFVNRVAGLAEDKNHHPDIDIRYNQVVLMLTTHDAGGLTALDFEVAREADGLATASAA